jgi:hypothetical protein
LYSDEYTIPIRGIPNGGVLRRMEGEMPDREEAANFYEKKLSKTINVLLLSLG